MQAAEQQLQWGRTFSSAEIFPIRRKKTMASTTSMGPHFFKCGNEVQLKMLSIMQYHFNGAALFQVRKFSPSPDKSQTPKLLQWGRTFSSAEMILGGTYTRRQSGLQWGRTFSSAEMARNRN